jgi:MazG family protein
MTAGREMEKLLALMARLRGPSGCPWDREQTLSSLRPFVLEEAYELVDAIQRGSTSAIREELGDLLLEVVFVNQIAEEQHLFTMEEVIRQIHDKLVRRHPHVFAEEEAPSAGAALARWEDVKAREKSAEAGKPASVLDGVPLALPALARAQKISTKAGRVGFDWPSPREVRAKLEEELDELDDAVAAGSSSAVAEEIGDVLFALVNLSRHLGVDAELSLSEAIDKFSARFRLLEGRLASAGRSVADATPDELDALWEEAKRVDSQPSTVDSKKGPGPL